MVNHSLIAGWVVAWIVFGSALSLQASESSVIWTEGEDAVSIPDGLPSRTANKSPASGRKSLIGKAFGKKGNKIGFTVYLPSAIDNAYLTMRYSRLHIMDWTAAEVTVTIAGKSGKIVRQEAIDQTGGWGALSGKEWGLYGFELGSLPSGRVDIEFTVQKDNSDLNLDGFFLSSGPLSLETEDFAACCSVQMSNQGGVGLQVANTAIDQKQFGCIQIIGKGFGEEKVLLTAVLLDEKREVLATIFRNRELALSPEPQVVEISPRDLPGLTDGAYTVKVHWDGGARSVSSSLVAMGDLMATAATKADEYEKAVRILEELDPQIAVRIKGDLVYAIEYIRHSLVLLKSRDGQFDTDDSSRRKAMSYFENALQRTAVDFSADLHGTIRQTDGTITRLDNGVDPYQGRSGDLRRAFYSTFSGRLEPYRLLIPASYWEASEYKFLLALHGAGGDENYFPENGNGSFAEAAARFGYLVAAPKANLKYRNGGEKDLKQLVDLMLMEYPALRPDQLYCTGVSMGGFGTYSMAHTYPDLFKAVAVVSSGLRGEPNPLEIGKLSNTPVLILHGKLDGVLPVENAYRLADELRKRGFVYELEVYPTYGHPYYGAEYLERTHIFFQKYQ